MSNEFYDYIAKIILGFFQEKKYIMRPGERYCLKLDTEEMVEGVDKALRTLLVQNDMQGEYIYEQVYSTYTIKLTSELEVVVSSKLNGMTDDFLATLRNAELTSKYFPILMITHSTIDTILSGTGSLSAKGMPFHATSIIAKIGGDIKNAQLSKADEVLLKLELERKQSDRFSDKSSLFEYSELLTVLGRGSVEPTDYPAFSLIPDDDIHNMIDERKIKDRLEENHKLFELIDRVIRHGNVDDDFQNIFDSTFRTYLIDCKKNNIPWYENCTYNQAKKSQNQLKKKLDNPLQINDDDFEAYSESPLQYLFVQDEKFFLRDDGNSKAKQRIKNVLIYNPDHCKNITITINTNISVRQTGIVQNGCKATSLSKQVKIELATTGCVFALTKIKDPNNEITYTVKICVIDLPPRFLEDIQTSYVLSVPNNLKRATIRVYGIDKYIHINPGAGEKIKERLADGSIYECSYDRTLELELDKTSIGVDKNNLDCIIKCGAVSVPLQIQDESEKPAELTGIGVFKWKHTECKSLEYRNGRLVSGTTEFYTKGHFRAALNMEDMFVKNEWLAINITPDGLKEYNLRVSDTIGSAYRALICAYKEKRTLPSLAYYSEEILRAAEQYVNAVEAELYSVEAGKILDSRISDTLFLGCVIKNSGEYFIAMSSLHPLNILYQMRLNDEQAVGNVRDSLVAKLTTLYLIPFIKDSNKELYHAIEQKDAPEWRYYVPLSNKRYQVSRNYVQKLVCEKISQYKEHFSFLFDDIGNRQLFINLVNMGDCQEVFQGLLRFYAQSLRNGIDPEDLLQFTINIYTEKGMYNAFFLLSDQHKLKEYIKGLCSDEEKNDLALIMAGNIRCYFRDLVEKTYQYAHLTFYEMSSAEDAGASRMNSITTGIALQGLTSGIPSVLNSGWYKTGFGMKHAEQNELTRMAAYYNALHRVAYSGSSYEPESGIFTEIEQGQEGQLGKIYSSSNWVVFVEPKVDLSFFQKKKDQDEDIMIIHYSDQYTSASGYDDITVTTKSDQYNEIIYEQLLKKGVDANPENIRDIINLFNAINGGWMLRLIAAKKLAGAADSYFSREKMSILSAIKVCMAYYSHPDIVWIPISLEEMLRVSGSVGLSQKEGILSARNLGFDQRATCDDILMVGIEGPKDKIKIYIHPVEVKIGQNSSTVLDKANAQVLNTYAGLWNALWPEEGRNELERKLSRNFFIQLLLVCCEKLKLYNIYPDENWDDVLDEYRENLLNERYEFSNCLDQYIGKGTVVSFSSGCDSKDGDVSNNVCCLSFPEKMGSSYMVLSAKEIEKDLETDLGALPPRLNQLYFQHDEEYKKNQIEDDRIIVLSDRKISYLSKSSDQKIAELPPEAYVAVTHGESDEPRIISTIHENDNMHGMEVLFGTDIATGNPILWYPNDTNQLFHTNTGIIGTMGTGKTQFTKSVITQLYREQEKNIGGGSLGILIFDYKGDYNESKEDFIKATNAKILKPYHLPYNPLALTKSKIFRPLLPIHTANAFKETLAKVYGLGPKQQNILLQSIIEAYTLKGIIADDPLSWEKVAPTFDTVYNVYSKKEEIKKNDSLAAAMDKLYQFQVFEGDPDKTKTLFELLNGVVVIDLSGYDPDIQSLIIAITLDLFYSQMQASGSSELSGQYRQLRQVILVDEADNFMSEGFPALRKILKEGREFGVGTILSTQFLKHFGNGEDDYAKYILTWVVHNVADLKASDVDFVFKTEPKSPESQMLYSDIKALKKHHSIIKIGNKIPQYIRDKAFWELYNELGL